MFTLLALLLTAIPLVAQTTNKETIKQSDQYYWGEGTSENEKEAADAALSALTQQIAVKVSAQYEHTQFEKNGNYNDQLKSVVSTYASATLQNVRMLKSLENGKINVFHYIERGEVEKIFRERVTLVKDIYDKAQEFEKEMDYGNALKWYYFATVLLNSVPARIVKAGEENLITELPGAINKLIDGIRFNVKTDRNVSEKEREIIFRMTTNEKPIRNLEFSFWDGHSQVNVGGVDGEAVVRLFEGSVKFTKLDIVVKYAFYESKEEIKEVAELWNVVVKPSFAKRKQVVLKMDGMQVEPVPYLSAYTLRLNNNEHCSVLATVEQETQSFLMTLTTGSVDSIQRRYADDKFIAEKMARILRYNNTMPIDHEINADINKTLTGWELRKIRVLHSYKSLNKQLTEYLILDFDKQGRLYDINFGIPEALYKTFIDAGAYGNDWGNRQVIVKFVERYRTAFLGRDIKTLDSLFAEEAVIIIGREMKKTRIKDVYKYSKMNDAQPEYEKVQYTKKQYLKNQQAVFKSQKDIFIGFSSLRILKKNTNEKTYGISMRQNYTSTTYGDEGYLFLLVDFNGNDPLIYVRSWQPHEWNDTAMIKLANYKVNR